MKISSSTFYHKAYDVYLKAVDAMLSMASMMRNSAESVPIVMSVPQKSLSIEPTMPTMFRWAHWLALSAETLSVSTIKITRNYWQASRECKPPPWSTGVKQSENKLRKSTDSPCYAGYKLTGNDNQSNNRFYLQQCCK